MKREGQTTMNRFNKRFNIGLTLQWNVLLYVGN